MQLRDITVVSELGKPKPHGAVLAWFEGVDDAQFQLSAATIGEIRSGIEVSRVRRQAVAARNATMLRLLRTGLAPAAVARRRLNEDQAVPCGRQNLNGT